jgi:hypothetical protein
LSPNQGLTDQDQGLESLLLLLGCQQVPDLVGLGRWRGDVEQLLSFYG